MQQTTNPQLCDVVVLTAVAAGKYRFRYVIPERLVGSITVGSHVQVPFGRQQVEAVVLEMLGEPSEGAIQAREISKLLSKYPLLTPEVFEYFDEIARYYAGQLPEVIRLAIPGRHVRAEREFTTYMQEHTAPMYAHATTQDLSEHWADIPAIAAFVQRALRGDAPLARWQYTPNWQDSRPSVQAGWPLRLAVLSTVVASQGRTAMLVMATQKQVNQLAAAFEELGIGAFDVSAPGPSYAMLTSGQSAQVRYQHYLAVSQGHTRIIIGTRSAILAPVADPAVIVVFDELSAHHREQRAPYFHTRRLALLRAKMHSAAVLFAGSSWSTDLVQQVQQGTVKDLPNTGHNQSYRGQLHVLPPEDEHRYLRVPPAAYRIIDETLERKEAVLIQVPSTGKFLVVRCGGCLKSANCQLCHGPLQFTGVPPRTQCQWCAHLQVDWRCRHCQSTKLHSSQIGVNRNADEFGRAFPGKTVIVSASNSHRGILETLESQNALVLATPGAEPVMNGGYGAVIVLDLNATLDRPGLRAGEQALGQVLRAAELVKSARLGGKVAVVGHVPTVFNNALVRWSPDLYLRDELADRRALNLPPHSQVIVVTGNSTPVNEVLAAMRENPEVSVLGPLTKPKPTTTHSQGRDESAQSDESALFDIEPTVSRGLLTFAAPGRAVVDQVGAVVTRLQLDKKQVTIQVEPWEILED